MNSNIEDLKARTEASEAREAALREDRDEWKQATIAANRRFEAAEARLRAVAALADELESASADSLDIVGHFRGVAGRESLVDHNRARATQLGGMATRLRAALASVPSGGVAPTEQAGEATEPCPLVVHETRNFPECAR